MNETNDAFLSKEIVLTLYRDLKDADSAHQIKIFNEYVKTVQHKYDDQVIEVESAKQIGFIHCDHQEYRQALPYLECIVNSSIVKPYLRKHLYFVLLAQANRMLKDFEKSLYWIEQAFEVIPPHDSGFMYLDLLNEYANLCEDASIIFESKYEPLVHKIIDELAFPQEDVAPVENVKRLQKLNQVWNTNLTAIKLAKVTDVERVALYREYVKNCEVGWYRTYVRKILDR